MASRNFGSRTQNYKNDFRRGMKDLRDDVEAVVLALEGEISIRAKNIVNGNIADLTAYTVAANASRNDNIANVEGDVVLLVGQTTAAQNGLYVVGTVAGGTAPLTRHGSMAAALTLKSATVEIAQGAVYSHTRWFSTASAPVIGTNDPAFYPEHVAQTVALVAGTTTVTNVPLLSATKSGIMVTRQAPGGTLTGTVQYVVNGAPTAGLLGTATFAVMAAVEAGTIQNADTSTVKIVVTNR
jgi:hypothetical protein